MLVVFWGAVSVRREVSGVVVALVDVVVPRDESKELDGPVLLGVVDAVMGVSLLDGDELLALIVPLEPYKREARSPIILRNMFSHNTYKPFQTVEVRQ